MIYLLSPRRGGPYTQLKLIATKLNEFGYPAKHCYTAYDWARLHLCKKDTIISVIPFFFVSNKKKFFLNIRGNYHKEKKITNPLSYLYEINIKYAAKLVLPSHFLKNELNFKNATVIPNSTDIKTKPAPLPPKDSTINIATITNFDFRPKAQGISKIINIINQLDSPLPLKLNIYGGGKWLNFAQHQYETNNFKKYPVIFHGLFHDPSNKLTQNDIFVYWSVFDNMPNVLTEAIACGLPVVANRYGAYEEILGPRGLLAQNEKQFSNYILDLIKNPNLRKLHRQRNLARAKLFNIDTNINHWIKTVDPDK